MVSEFERSFIIIITIAEKLCINTVSAWCGSMSHVAVDSVQSEVTHLGPMTLTAFLLMLQSMTVMTLNMLVYQFLAGAVQFDVSIGSR